jgi:DNA polymerase-3 subunit epsilon
LRLIKEHRPRFNRRHRSPVRSQWVKLTTAEAFPRLSIVRSTKGAGVYLGPISNRRTAELVVDALHTVVPLRRCSARIGRTGQPTRDGLCVAAQLGVAMCPCSGELEVNAYEPIVDEAARLMTSHPHIALEGLRRRMEELARSERFEDAAAVRDRAGALAATVERSRRLVKVANLGTIVLEFESGVVRIDTDGLDVEERLLVGGWIDRHGPRARVLVGSDALSSPLPRLASFSPRR